MSVRFGVAIYNLLTQKSRTQNIKTFTQADYSNTKACTHSIKLTIYSDICLLLSFSSYPFSRKKYVTIIMQVQSNSKSLSVDK